MVRQNDLCLASASATRTLRGERPYWYVRELAKATKAGEVNDAAFQQNAQTCETGPGLPSGHCMSAMLVAMALYDTLTNKILDRFLAKTSFMYIIISRLAWNALVAVQLAVAAARVYNLNHFPHQCAAAFICGLVVLQTCYYRDLFWVAARSRAKAVAAVALVVGAAVALYFGLQTNGLDPDWTLDYAARHCRQRAWLSVDTTPFFGLVRLAGAALGLAMAVTGGSRLVERSADATGVPVAQMLARAAIGVVVGFTASASKTLAPKADVKLYYAFAGAAHALTAYFVLAYVPWVARRLTGGETPAISKDILKEEEETRKSVTSKKKVISKRKKKAE